MVKYLVMLFVFLAVWVSGCSNSIIPDTPKAVLEVDWIAEDGKPISLATMSANDFTVTSINTNLQYGLQKNASGVWVSRVEASLVDEHGGKVPNTTFEYQFAAVPEYNIWETQGNVVRVTFNNFGKGVLTVMATTGGEVVTGEFGYKVFASGAVRTTHLEHGVTPEFDLETNENVNQDGDAVCIGNILHAPYGFVIQTDLYDSLEEFDGLKDIRNYDYSKTGALWEISNVEAMKKIYLLRTKNGGYVKLCVNHIQGVPMGCEFFYEYSPTGIFE